MVYRKLKVVCLLVLFFWGGVRADQGLSRGHQILIDKGLQVQAVISPVLRDTWDDVGFSLQQFDSSNFTGVNLEWNNQIENHISSASNVQWSRFFARTEMSLRAEELPFLSSLVSIQYRDEQSVKHPRNLTDAKLWLANMRELYPDVISYLNQAATASTEQQLRYFMRYAEPDMIRFDLYPFYGDEVAWSPYMNGSRSSYTHFLERLQLYRNVALEGYDGTGDEPIPYSLYTQSKKTGSEDYRVSESEIRLNQFVPWTFGYTFLTSYVYTSPTFFVYDYSDLFNGLGDTSPTDSFYYMAETNRQSINLGSALTRLKSIDIRIIPGYENQKPYNISRWTATSTSEPYITNIDCWNLGSENGGYDGDLVIGYFKPLLESFDGEQFSNQFYFMITNGLSCPDATAYQARQRVRIDFDFGISGINSLQKLSRDTGMVELVSLVHDGGSLYHIEYDLDGGTGDLFKFNSGASFVGFSI